MRIAICVVLLVASGVAIGEVPAVRVEPRGGYDELVVDGLETVRSTSDEILDARVIGVSDSPVLLVLWDEVPTDGPRKSFFAISLDGRTVSRARETSYDIRLNYGAFDPAQSRPPVPPQLAAGAQTELYIVQFVTQPLEVFRDRIRAIGGSVYGFLANHTHLVHMTPDVRARVEELPFVRWVGPFHPAYRLEPYLRDNLHRAEALPAQQRYYIRVGRRGATLKNVVAGRIEAMGGTIDANYPDGYLLQATLTSDQLQSVIEWDEVLYVDRWSPPEDDMDLAREIGGANLIEGIEGFTGQGVRAEVMDGNVNEEHPELMGGVIIHRSGSGSVNHGTSTTGVNFADGSGNSAARGMVPDARGVFASYVGLTNRFTHTTALSQAPYFAVYQSNSWGSTRTTEYNNTSSDFDDLLFQNDILVCQSQSNAGNQQSRPQAWAKNTVSIGGVTHRNNLNPDDDFWDDASIGPAADGRVKPDLVHFYDNIFTTTGAGYTNFCCTSGATPIVAGHFGLLFQMWHEGIFGNPVSGSVFHSRPHMSTSKALMINAASRYPFSGLNANLTRTHQGWGMPDLQRMFDARERTFVVDETDILTNLGSVTYTLTVPADSDELRATLVYSDLPGLPFASVHRINDLTLRVVSPNGTFYYGNDGLLVGNVSTPNGSPNTIDTVENVFIADPLPGEWTFEVRADEVNEDSHVETAATDADFALVVSGVLPASPAGSYFDGNTDGDVDLGDFAQFGDCFTGPVGSDDFQPIAGGCEAADCDGDADIDFADYACFARSFSGSCGVRINVEPEDQAACIGGSATFQVDAEGENASYQWFRGANVINGATQSSFSILPVSAASAADYFVLVSTDCNAVESVPVTLAVSQPPQILAHPTDVSACFGGPASFSVTASGVGAIQYQWRLDGTSIPGAVNATYTIPAVGGDDIGDYRCSVLDDCSVAVLTDVAQLTTESTEFSIHPLGGDTCEGGSIFLFTLATSSPDYQWFKDGAAIDGATGTILVVSNVDAGDSGAYHVVATGMCNTVVSDDAVITIISCD